MSAVRTAGDGTVYIVPGEIAESNRNGTVSVVMSGVTDLPMLIETRAQYPLLWVPLRPLRDEPLPDLSGFRRVINLVTEAECVPQLMENVRRFVRDVPDKVLNHPDKVMTSTRDLVAKQLAGIRGLLVPRAIRLAGLNRSAAAKAIARAGLNWPIILREAGTHSGRIKGRFDDADALPDGLASERDHIATEFVDFRSADGLYRKYRVFFFGRQRVLRHMLASDEWNVHMADRRRFMARRSDLQAEEEQLFKRPEGAFAREVDRVLKKIRERISLDFFGLDFGIMPDGRVVLFEANATMNFFPFLDDPEFAYVKQCLDPAQSACRAMVGADGGEADPGMTSERRTG